MAEPDPTLATLPASPRLPLEAVFERRFGSRPTRRVRAPGRVRLLGEHVADLELPVLAIAIPSGIEIVLRPRDDGRVRLLHAEQGERELELPPGPGPSDPGDWGAAVLAAAAVLVHDAKRGFDAAVGGDPPRGAGLASSSARVVASALALLEVNGVPTERIPLAALLASADGDGGSRGDMAASLCGREGCALWIEPSPLRVEPLSLPADWRCVVAPLPRLAATGEEARHAHDRLRAAGEHALAHLTALPDLGASARSYKDLCALTPLAELLELGEQALPPPHLAIFRHVVTEHARVAEAREAIAAGDGERLGRAMDACHQSLREELGLSTPGIDRLVEAARAGGALGARLAGTRESGCVVAQCRAADAPRVLAALGTPTPGARGASAPEREPAFVAAPSAGAAVEAL